MKYEPPITPTNHPSHLTNKPSNITNHPSQLPLPTSTHTRTHTYQQQTITPTNNNPSHLSTTIHHTNVWKAILEDILNKALLLLDEVLIIQLLCPGFLPQFPSWKTATPPSPLCPSWTPGQYTSAWDRTGWECWQPWVSGGDHLSERTSSGTAEGSSSPGRRWSCPPVAMKVAK